MRHFHFFGDRRHISYKLFRSWHNILRDYEIAWGRNCLAYVYNQQPNVGLLALAAYREGWLPFVDFSTRKREHGGREYQGRCDLSIFFKRGKELFVEAERVDVRLQDDVADLKDKIAKPLKKATDDVDKIIEKYHRAMGVVFILPWKATEGDFDPDGFANRLDVARGKLEADFCAVHLCRREIWSRVLGNDCPGIAAVGKHVQL